MSKKFSKNKEYYINRCNQLLDDFYSSYSHCSPREQMLGNAMQCLLAIVELTEKKEKENATI
jgi:hypothetical protein